MNNNNNNNRNFKFQLLAFNFIQAFHLLVNSDDNLRFLAFIYFNFNCVVIKVVMKVLVFNKFSKFNKKFDSFFSLLPKVQLFGNIKYNSQTILSNYQLATYEMNLHLCLLYLSFPLFLPLKMTRQTKQVDFHAHVASRFQPMLPAASACG